MTIRTAHAGRRGGRRVAVSEWRSRTRATTAAPRCSHAERYAELLDALGFAEQRVRTEVYGHHLESTAAVVEWTKGTTLTRVQRLLTADLYEAFVERYRGKASSTPSATHAPYFYTFKRILFWARLPTTGDNAERVDR